MNVLLTHLHLDWPAGSETYTYTLVNGLTSAGHDVTVVTPIACEVARRIRERGVPVLEDLADAAGTPFDVVHAQHNVMALAARAHFPTVPLLFHSHGTVPDPEQPPSVDANIQLYVAVSELVRDHLASLDVSEELIHVLHNPVDTDRFRPGPALHELPRRAAVISGIIDSRTLSVIRSATGRLGIELVVVGRDGDRPWAMEDVLPEFDIVFSLGRGAIEAMACGRAVFVYDVHGADGWVTPETVGEIERCTFSGKRFRRDLSEDELAAELEGYGRWMGPANRGLAEDRYDLGKHVEELVGLYKRAISRFRVRRLELPRRELDAVLRTLRARVGEREARLERHQTRIHLLQLELRDRSREMGSTTEERR